MRLQSCNAALYTTITGSRFHLNHRLAGKPSEMEVPQPWRSQSALGHWKVQRRAASGMQHFLHCDKSTIVVYSMLGAQAVDSKTSLLLPEEKILQIVTAMGISRATLQ